MLTRRGATLAELLVALTLGAIILGVATGSLLRQQRTTLAMTTAARSGTALRLATALFAAQAANHGPDDLAGAALEDTAFQLRSAVAVGSACESSASPSFAVGGPDLSAGGLASPPRQGDSLWWYRPEVDGWAGRLVTAAHVEAGACGAPSPASPLGTSTTVHLRLAGTDTIPALTPVRLTRQERLVLYRASDGGWHLGLREWNVATQSLGSPQPVAGPFVRGQSRFRYFDAGGAELQPPLGASDPPVARVGLTAVSPGTARARAMRDSVDVALHAPAHR
ncbi:MAG: hypothetical protein JWL60_994 [Gemmatimonadetes bacterium]|nr:hypothetical protein [Gemmatimonadota bacterium]